MKNKICLVTGATSGIGFATAMELAKLGATVVVGGRDMEKAANAVIKIRSESNNPNVDFLLADLSDFEEVKKLAEDFKSQYSRLDVLVNNAGAAFREFDTNANRIEMTMALNFFSPFLLTGLLMEKLQESVPSRIINVSSMLHQMAKNYFRDYNDEQTYKALNAYSLSKLALLHFTYELAAKLKGTGVTANAMHPGWVKSNFGKDIYTGFYGVIDTIFKPFQSTPEQGASTIIYLASSKDIENETGKYYIKKKESKSSTDSYDKKVSSELWDLAESVCHFNYLIKPADLSKTLEKIPGPEKIETPKEDDTKSL